MPKRTGTKPRGWPPKPRSMQCDMPNTVPGTALQTLHQAATLISEPQLRHTENGQHNVTPAPEDSVSAPSSATHRSTQVSASVVTSQVQVSEQPDTAQLYPSRLPAQLNPLPLPSTTPSAQSTIGFHVPPILHPSHNCTHTPAHFHQLMLYICKDLQIYLFNSL